MGKVVIDVNAHRGVVNKNIYGHFAEHLGRCIYNGLFVGEDSEVPNVNGIRSDVVEALRNIKAPVLRWPGGCFADEYHWRDGVGTSRKKMINTHWGGAIEDNSFGTHEFMELCAQVGCEPYVNGNLGSGTVQEMSEWVEYMTFGGVSPMAALRAENGRFEPWKLRYFAVGNENWGCGGNMRPEHYADEFRRYQTYCRNYGDNRLYKVACGPNGDDYEWTETLMRIAGRFMDGLSLHYYTVPGTWESKGSATEFTKDEYYATLDKARAIDDMIAHHLAIMDRYDPERRIGLVVDEWGCWYDVEPGTNPGFLYQQNTMRDAMVAATTLDIFAKYCDRVPMANIAQTVNVLQSVILTENDQMLLTPTYHVFDLYKNHHDATRVEHWLEQQGMDNQISATASVNDGVVTLTISNTSASDGAEMDLELLGASFGSAKGRVLSGEVAAHNTFEHPNAATIAPLEVGKTGEGVRFALPHCSVAEITVS